MSSARDDKSQVHRRCRLPSCHPHAPMLSRKIFAKISLHRLHSFFLGNGAPNGSLFLGEKGSMWLKVFSRTVDIPGRIASIARGIHHIQNYISQVVAAASGRLDGAELSRRSVFSLVAASGAIAAFPAQSLAAAGKEVGNYLPPAGIDDFVRYVPGRQSTPAIRAGTVNPDQPYTFAIPPNWTEVRRRIIPLACIVRRV